jgi:hypothetical protein
VTILTDEATWLIQPAGTEYRLAPCRIRARPVAV